MSSTRAPSRFILAMFASMMFAGATPAIAADQPSPAAPPAPSKEMREKMAAMHERMAACLRSDRPVADCRKEMQQGCQAVMGKEGCPMTGMGMHGGMMGEPPATKPSTK